MKEFFALLNRHQGVLSVISIIVSIFIAAAPWLSSDWMKLPEQQRNTNTAVIFFICIVVLSIIIDSWYDRSWGRLSGFQLFSTAASRASLIQRGRDEVEKRVAAERRALQRPRWWIARRDWGGDLEDVFILYNRGKAVAWNVEVRSMDPDEMVISDPNPLKGTFDNDPMGDTGRQVVGYLREKGEREGVHLCISWVDLNGDRQEEPLFIPPEDLVLR